MDTATHVGLSSPRHARPGHNSDTTMTHSSGTRARTGPSQLHTDGHATTHITAPSHASLWCTHTLTQGRRFWKQACDTPPPHSCTPAPTPAHSHTHFSPPQVERRGGPAPSPHSLHRACPAAQGQRSAGPPPTSALRDTDGWTEIRGASWRMGGPPADPTGPHTPGDPPPPPATLHCTLPQPLAPPPPAPAAGGGSQGWGAGGGQVS